MYGLDLFSGLGGLTKALEGYVTPVAYCENDTGAQMRLLARMASGALPYAPIWDDVRTLHAREGWPRIDIILAGFPCTDISIANTNGKGLEGERSGLFKEIMRIADDVEPSFIFLENVPGVVKYLHTITSELSKRRYDARWKSICLAELGTPCLRERWFCLAFSPRFGLDTCLPQIDLPRQTREEVQRDEARWRCRLFRDNRGQVWKAPTSTFNRVDYGLKEERDRLTCLGNAVHPAQARQAFEDLCGLSA